MLVIGDIRGKYSEYLSLLGSFDGPSVQIGDFGFGFGPVPPRPDNSYFFRGNHDSPDACRADKHYLGEYGSREIGGVKFFFLGGAWSIDYKFRTEGISWWRDEELSIHELTQAIELYADTKPDLVLTHDGPNQATEDILETMVIHKTKPIETRTGQALTAMFRIHQPKRWIFGHWHVSWTKQILGTQFQCLAELGFTKVENEPPSR